MLRGPRRGRRRRRWPALPGLSGLRLPKVDPCPDVRARRSRRGPPACRRCTRCWSRRSAIEHAYAIASAHPAVAGIALGEADLRADLGVRDDAGLDWPRSRVVVAARAAGLAPPAQSVYPDVRDLDGLRRRPARTGGRSGFSGRAAIHPRQLPVIERAFLPTPRGGRGGGGDRGGVADARRGALALPDGRFVDAAVVAAAQRTLALARCAGRGPEYDGREGAAGPWWSGGPFAMRAGPGSASACLLGLSRGRRRPRGPARRPPSAVLGGPSASDVGLPRTSARPRRRPRPRSCRRPSCQVTRRPARRSPRGPGARFAEITM